MNIKYLIPIIILISLLFIPDVFAVSCGDTITQDTILSNDLIDCPGIGINIGQDNITLDCNSHHISLGGPYNGTTKVGVYSTFDNVVIKNCNISGVGYGGVGMYIVWDCCRGEGVQYNYPHNNTILNNHITNFGYAIYSVSVGSKFINNTINNNDYGIVITYSENNLIENNKINNSTGYAILIHLSEDNLIVNNNITNSDYAGILLYSRTRASTYNVSINNTIKNNYLINNYGGIFFTQDAVGNFSNTNIYNNYFNNLINVDFSPGIIYGPIYWNTSKQLSKNILGGQYLGGNYWSDYTGNDTNGDGIGDTNIPYNANGMIQNSGDFLPLVRLPTICIDPGHGGVYHGATGIDGVTKEKDLNLDIANKFRNILIIKGFNVVMTRETDTELVSPLDPNNITDNDIEKDIQARVKVCKDTNSDLMISFHNNANADPNIRGTSTFYFDATDEDNEVFPNDVPLTNPEVSTLRYKLANSIMKNVIETAKTNEFLFYSSGGKTGTIPDWEFYHTYHLSLLRNAYPYDAIMPTTLIETAFMSNPDDFYLLNNNLFRKAVATGIYNGIIDYLGYGEKIILDSDKDGVVNSQDKCPYDSSQGYDSNNDGCKDLTPPSTTQPSQPKKLIKIL